MIKKMALVAVMFSGSLGLATPYTTIQSQIDGGEVNSAASCTSKCKKKGYSKSFVNPKFVNPKKEKAKNPYNCFCYREVTSPAPLFNPHATYGGPL